LKSIDLSWNGLGYEGILALCGALRTNTTLQIINLSNNINKTDRDDMSEILLKVALNTTNQPTNLVEITYFYSL
jgi:Ran GTPase-activating protein (RanGAP) involved in mRNA processing and transport